MIIFRENQHNMKMNELNQKISMLNLVIDRYSFFTGVVIKKTGDNYFQIIYNDLNPADPEEQCTIELTLFNDTFLVSDMTPRLKDYYEFVQYVSLYRDLKTFIRLARKSFLEHFASQKTE